MKGFLLSLALAVGTVAAQTEVAAVRLGHFSPDAPLLDLLIDGKLRVRDLTYTQLSSYHIVPAGEHELKIMPHRASSEPSVNGSTSPEAGSSKAPQPMIITVTLEPGRYYTLLASGYFDPPPNQEQLGTLSLRLTNQETVTVTGPRGFATTITETSELSDLFPGVYTITAQQEGFKSAVYEVEVKPNETTFLSVTLQANDRDETLLLHPLSRAVPHQT
jgi:hypothetical protein